MFLVSGDLLLRFSVTENLSALDFTKKKVIKNEALFELKLALKHQTCTIVHVIFNTGDTVFLRENIY